MKEKTYNYKQASKQISEKELNKALLKGQIIPLVKNPKTGELQRFRVTSINGDDMEGHFLNS